MIKKLLINLLGGIAVTIGLLNWNNYPFGGISLILGFMIIVLIPKFLIADKDDIENLKSKLT
ncbi:unnamed protein product [marine sediment metagenome]|uniref:Uncharacterized protein n=1 Tax=marine sediment metagenome TaxID=412755 RepID=X1AED7_9ZZZZ